MEPTIPAVQLALDDPDGLAIGSPLGDLSWSRVADEMMRAASALKHFGFKRKERLAVLGENSPETLLLYGAATLAGVGVIPLNFHLTANEIEYVLADSGAVAIWSGREAESVAGEAALSVGIHCSLERQGVTGANR